MNENNLAFLKKALDRTGFPAEVGDKLATEVQQQKPEIKISHEMNRGNETVNFDLNFRKSDTSDMYFFNSYNATLKTGNEDYDKTQQFRIRNGNNVEMNEAFNLIAGRSVEKSLVNGDGDTYLAWLKIDFSAKDNWGNHKVDQFHQKYGYDLNKALDKFPIAELAKPEEREKLIESIKAGNPTAVMMSKDGKEAMFFVEANLRHRTINIKDENGTSVKRDSLEIKDASKSKAVAENQGQENSQKNKRGQRMSA